jgi:hypothetical protein
VGAPLGSLGGSFGSGTGKSDRSTSGATGGFASGSAGLGFTSAGSVGMACHLGSAQGTSDGLDFLHIRPHAPVHAVVAAEAQFGGPKRPVGRAGAANLD